MIRRLRTFMLVCTVIAAFAASLGQVNVTAATAEGFTLTSVMRQDEPVTYFATQAGQTSTLDPQRAEDVLSITAIEQLFLGLTNNDPVSPGNIVPEMATDWSVDEAGTQWTFTIRDDVPWVLWNPVMDEGEVLRNVTAGDIAYGIRRSCDPRLAAYYTSVADKMILGCDELSGMSTDEVTDEDYDLVQVFAPDDTTLVVNLQYPSGFFFSETTMWMYRAVPQEIIEEYGDDWTEAGTIVTNGPFVLDEYIQGVRQVYVRNPFLPDDLRGPGNVERVVISIVEDLGTQFALYIDNQIDRAGVPAAELQSVLGDPVYADQLTQSSDLAVFYVSYAHDKAPFDNVHVRRAFSASLDREAYIQEILQGRGVPMIHLTPPGMFGAPPINEVGVGYDPDYARAEMEAAGYPNCEGFAPLTIVAASGADTSAEFLMASVERELGCDPGQFTLEQQEFSVLLQSTDPRTATEDRPSVWVGIGWGPDYPDANNWVGDVLACESENTFMRPCTEVDDLITEAARESDPAVRTELYYRIEEMFFGPEGEFPIAPLYMRINYALTKPWVTGPLDTDGLFGGAHYDWRTIDQAMQLAARG